MKPADLLHVTRKRLKSPSTLLICSFLLILLISLTANSCKKMVEDTKKEYVLDIITNGLWHVQFYEEAGTDITLQFDGFNFQFRENGTVSAFFGTSDIGGTWEGDLVNYAIVSNFPGATDPLKKLNGTWKLKDSGNDFVVSEMETDAGKMRLRLEKNP